MTNEEKVVQRLTEKGYKIAFAESCTGGLCCATLVSVPSAASVLEMSFTTYANDAKIQLIDVNAETIKAYGVVSEEVAAEMCLGVASKAKSEVGVGVTGIAGPTGATATKPIGMVCFGFNIKGDVYTFTKQFGDIGRNNVRNSSVKFVFETLMNILEKY